MRSFMDAISTLMISHDRAIQRSDFLTFCSRVAIDRVGWRTEIRPQSL